MSLFRGRVAATVLATMFSLVLTAFSASAQQAGADAQAGETGEAPGTQSPFMVCFQAAIPFGLVNTAILIPGDSGGGMNPIDMGWGFGLGIEYAIVPYVAVFLDGNLFTCQKQVGVAGQYSSSFWVHEMTGYSTNQLGPFDEDAFFYMDSTGFRLGGKVALPVGALTPWAGVAYGYYSWTATYGTADRSGKWGQDSGYVWGLTYLLGVDWRLTLSPGNEIIFRVYADLASPVANPLMEDLFNPGWTWDNSGGNHIMGPYRFGIAIGMPM